MEHQEAHVKQEMIEATGGITCNISAYQHNNKNSINNINIYQHISTTNRGNIYMEIYVLYCIYTLKSPNY